MTYTAVNPHACCNWPRPEDAHAVARSPPHPHASTHSPTTTDCAGRLVAGRQQTAPPQQRRSKDDTAHPPQPGAHPNPPHPDPARSHRHNPAKAKVKLVRAARLSPIVGQSDFARFGRLTTLLPHFDRAYIFLFPASPSPQPVARSSVTFCGRFSSSRCSPPPSVSSSTFQRDSAWQSTSPHLPLYSGLPEMTQDDFGALRDDPR